MRKRMVSLFLAVLLLTSLCAKDSYAASPAVTLDPLSYFLSLLLNSAGVQVGLSSVASWVGVEDSYEAYELKGKAGQLSSFSQWYYDKTSANSADGEAMKAEFERCFGGFAGVSSAAWGDKLTVSSGAMDGFMSNLRTWLKTFPSYGTDSTYYGGAPAKTDTYMYALDPYSVAFFNLNVTKMSSDIFVIPMYLGKSNGVKYFFISKEHFTMSYYDTYYNELTTNFTRSEKAIYEGKSYVYYYNYAYASDRDTNICMLFDTPVDKITQVDGTFPHEEIAPFVKELLYDNPSVFVQAVNPAIQEAALGKIGNTITLPADEAVAQEKLEGINLQDDIENILKSLIAGGITIDVAPDIPDESETTTEDADKKTIIAKLSDILAKLEAIPKAIAEFFTLDTVAIDTAFKNLLAAFSGKFEILAKLVNIFKDVNRTFSDTPPVFKMQTPDCLKFAIKEDTMTVLDLTGYKDVFFWVRGILAASIWFAFGKWLLDQFDVKFHIG